MVGWTTTRLSATATARPSHDRHTYGSPKDFALLLYVLHQRLLPQQTGEEWAQLSITVEPLTKRDFTTVPSTILSPYKNPKGTLALVAPRFSDPLLGFGIVRLQTGHASTQRVVTRCTYYQRFTTEEALQAAADSYGGLTTSNRKSSRQRPKVKPFGSPSSKLSKRRLTSIVVVGLFLL